MLIISKPGQETVAPGDAIVNHRFVTTPQSCTGFLYNYGASFIVESGTCFAVDESLCYALFRNETSFMQDRLANIQVLRAVAASMVLVSHIGTEIVGLARQHGSSIEFLSAPWATGVDVFFVVSGFIMLVTTASEFGRPGAAIRFLRRRLVRIVPLYWALTTILVVGGWAVPALLNVPIGDVSHIAASYLFWPSVRGMDEIRPVLALGWTLQYEMLFYVLFTCALFLPRRIGLIVMAVSMVALVMLGRLLAHPGVAISFWSSPIVFEFLFGVGCGWIFLNLRERLRLNAGASAVVILTGIALLLLSGHSSEHREQWSSLVSIGLPSAMVVTGAAVGPQLQGGLIASALVGLGEASYSLYLFHPFVLRPLRVLWDRVDGPLWIYGVLSLATALLASVVVHKLVEKPLTRAAGALVPPARKECNFQAAE